MTSTLLFLEKLKAQSPAPASAVRYGCVQKSVQDNDSVIHAAIRAKAAARLKNLQAQLKDVPEASLAFGKSSKRIYQACK